MENLQEGTSERAEVTLELEPRAVHEAPKSVEDGGKRTWAAEGLGTENWRKAAYIGVCRKIDVKFEHTARASPHQQK